MNAPAKSITESTSVLSPKQRFPTLRVHLELGRVSNLPTVWTNVFAGSVLALAAANVPLHQLPVASLATLMLAMSAFYIAGMYLNDACDVDIDRIERPTRPIPSNRITLSNVYLGTLCWFSVGWGLLFLVGSAKTAEATSVSWILSAAALTGSIILYDLFHKNNPFSPVIMGVCRILVIVTSYLMMMNLSGAESRSATASLPLSPLLLPCSIMLAYLISLTFIAKFESTSSMLHAWPIAVLLIPVGNGVFASTQSQQLLPLIPALMLMVVVYKAFNWIRTKQPGGIPKAIGFLIAGISLLDAIVMASAGSVPGLLFGLFAFVLTVLLQRKIAGT